MNSKFENPSVVIVDRDGVLNDLVEGDYVRRPDQLKLRPGAADAVRMANLTKTPIFVATNQRGVALNLMSETDLADVHQRLQTLLNEFDAHLDGIYACIHGLRECVCRKPLPGLIHLIRKDNAGLNFDRTVFIGDSDSDVATARAANVFAIRVSEFEDPKADATSPSLLGAATDILWPPVRPVPRA